MLKNFDLKFTVIACSLVGGFILSHIYYNQILFCIKCLFEFPYLNLYVGGVSTIFTVLCKIKARKVTLSANMSFRDFQTSVGDVISFVDNPIIIVCSIALAKGLFLQSTEGKIYYPYFNSLEVTFILLITVYLLFISLMELWNNIYQTCWSKPIESSGLKAVAEDETKGKAVPSPEQ